MDRTGSNGGLATSIQAEYDRACRNYNRWFWLTLGIFLVTLFAVYFTWQAMGSKPRVWNVLCAIWSIVLIFCCVKQLPYYVTIKRYRVKLARLNGESVTWLTPFTFAPHEQRDIWTEPLQWGRDIVWRNFPISLVFAPAAAITTLLNILQNGPK